MNSKNISGGRTNHAVKQASTHCGVTQKSDQSHSGRTGTNPEAQTCQKVICTHCGENGHGLFCVNNRISSCIKNAKRHYPELDLGEILAFCEANKRGKNTITFPLLKQFYKGGEIDPRVERAFITCPKKRAELDEILSKKCDCCGKFGHICYIVSEANSLLEELEEAGKYELRSLLMDFMCALESHNWDSIDAMIPHLVAGIHFSVFQDFICCKSLLERFRPVPVNIQKQEKGKANVSSCKVKVSTKVKVSSSSEEYYDDFEGMAVGNMQ
jgi:hypothetical protein